MCRNPINNQQAADFEIKANLFLDFALTCSQGRLVLLGYTAGNVEVRLLPRHHEEDSVAFIADKRSSGHPLTRQTPGDADMKLSLRFAFRFQVFSKRHGPRVLNQHRLCPIDCQLARRRCARSWKSRTEARFAWGFSRSRRSTSCCRERWDVEPLVDSRAPMPYALA